jgi:hypothetical protein
MRALIVSTLVLIAVCALGQEPVPDLRDYEKVLIPLSFPSPRAGAYGSLWATELKVFNGSNDLIQLFQGTPNCRISAGCGSYPYPTMFIGPGDYGNPGFLFPARLNPSGLVYVEKEKGEAIHFSLHVRDLSRGNESFGTELGVARESEFRNTAVYFLNVPIASNLRHTLRIYDVDPELREGSPARARVRAFEPFSSVDVMNTVYELPERNDFGMIERPLPAIAGYVEVALNDLRSSSVSGDRLIIGVEPLTPGLRFWTMLSVTDNVTQHATLFTPQN